MAQRQTPDAHKAPYSAETGRRLLGSPFLWGLVFTFGFYGLIPYLPWQRELVQRYFCSHPIENVTAGLFFIGLALLLFKALGLKQENRALAIELAAGGSDRARTPDHAAHELTLRLQEIEPELRGTLLVRRLRDLCAYVRGKQSVEGLEEHARYLAELSLEKQGQSYALVRTVTWAVPILGFLGTVMGITIAVANVTPDQLDSSLSSVTGGLAVAFDTTALALALSLVLVFATFLVERAEQALLARIEEFVIARVSVLFPIQSGAGSLVAAESAAAELMLERTHELIARQTALWEQSLADVRRQWTQTLENQQQHLDSALQQGMAATLNEHHAGLDRFRDEFVTAYSAVSQQLTETIQTWQRQQYEQLEQNRTHSAELWQQVQAHAGGVTARLESAAGATQAALTSAMESAIAQQEELRRQREILLQVIGRESELVRLQSILAENLQALQQTDTFEQTMHSLSAAVHVLTANLRHRAA